MPPVRREPLIAGIVAGCIAFALLLSTLLFYFVRLYHQRARAKRVTALSRLKSKPRLSLDYSAYFRPLQEKAEIPSPLYSCPAYQSPSSSLLSPRTPEWLVRPLMLPLPPPSNRVDFGAAAHPVFGLETCPDRNTARPSHIPACYSPSLYSLRSFRDSAITLFEEDTTPVGLGIWTIEVEGLVGSRSASVRTGRANRMVQIGSDISSSRQLDAAPLLEKTP